MAWRTDLYGWAADGRPAWWARGTVSPVATFDSEGPWIGVGHYVVDYEGAALVALCGNAAGGMVTVLFVGGSGKKLRLPRAEAEAMLLGRVLPLPVPSSETGSCDLPGPCPCRQECPRMPGILLRPVPPVTRQ